MKKRLQYALFLIIFIFLSGCGAGDSTPSSTPNNTPDSTPDSTPEISSAVTTYGQYAGTWAQEEISWLNGGVILDISVEANTMRLSYLEVTVAPFSFEGEFDVTLPLSDIQNDSVEVDFINDGWGNAGTMRITFDDDQLLCRISDVHYIGEDEASIWQVTATTSVLVRMDNAHELIEYSLDDYYALYPDENPDNWMDNDPTTYEPVYDTTKASGILASIGITEDEFRAACTSLQNVVRTGNGIITSYNTGALDEIRSYPNQYLGNYFCFPNFEVEQKGASTDGYPYYIHTVGSCPIQIFDFRDNVYTPTISKGNKICAYVIFTDIQLNGLGQDVLCFCLISCDDSVINQ